MKTAIIGLAIILSAGAASAQWRAGQWNSDGSEADTLQTVVNRGGTSTGAVVTINSIRFGTGIPGLVFVGAGGTHKDENDKGYLTASATTRQLQGTNGQVVVDYAGDGVDINSAGVYKATIGDDASQYAGLFMGDSMSATLCNATHALNAFNGSVTAFLSGNGMAGEFTDGVGHTVELANSSNAVEVVTGNVQLPIETVLRWGTNILSATEDGFLNWNGTTIGP